MSMDFNNNRSIFLQIADSICEQITNGTHPPGSKIASVRELAAEMGVNPNTVLRTFNELQMRAIIENRRGIGFYVTSDAKAKIINWKKEDFFNTVLPEFARQMAIAGVSFEDLRKHFEKDQ